ncbi:hypothetical protein SteCoe_36591 [Stentor coeruleus]|uniref:UvrD-like helicase ATP-binding domain-containing protein n=1 Tax=Stentor coeruleus TaxID=5963 RepID=A0A1R2APX4_9CILI|nr:hypothetical protein SteCoe_36591 [Stentor coeruleus]
MGKQKQKTKQEKYANIRMDSMMTQHKFKVDQILQRIIMNASYVESQYIRFDCRKDHKRKIFHHYTEIWLKWLDFDIEKYEKDAFAGIEAVKLNDYEQLWKAPSQDIFWKAINFYKNCSELKWTMRFTLKAKKKMLMFNYGVREYILTQMIEFSLGYIVPGKNCKVVEEGPCANMIFFSTGLKGTESNLLFAFILDRIPIIRNYKLVQFRFSHYIKVIDFVKREKDIKNSIEAFKNSLKNDPDHWIEPSLDYYGHFIYPSFATSVVRFNEIYVYPKEISRIYLTNRETELYGFNSDKMRWLAKCDILSQDLKVEVDPYQISLINKLGNSASCTEFISFLKKIPDFRIKLTEEQEKLIGSPGNVLAIGRSGTGKTTCSILRLLSTEILFRYALRDRSKRFSPEELDRSTLLHTIFVTASPVLTNEVKRYYERISGHIKDKLKARDEKIKAKEQEVEVIDLEMKEQSLECSESEEEDEGKDINSMEFLRDEDFPLFVTVRKIIFMVDASMKRPFFARNREGKLIGLNSKFTWHNEQKGALMINKQFKAQRMTEDIGKIEVENSESDSDEEIEIQDKSPFDKSHKNKKLAMHNFYKKSYRHLSYEVDYSIFANKFFPRIQGHSRFSPLLLWTEISAYIKGSAQSYKYPGYYLPRAVYMSMGRKVSMLSEADKSDIWDLFIVYERWKVREDAYDMQDVINYLLNQVSFYGYNGVPVHYMMVDEVQDLTPATLYLLLHLTKQKLFFSGDTAQTIAKGVGFRFCDLKSLFSESRLDTPKVCQLTMNFRTHNQILGLANSIVALLETLFPLTIDKMAKEISPINGPMPIIMSTNNIEQLLFIMFGNHSQVQTKQPEFGCNQVIIVRNQESKEKIPSMMRHALCLTVFEAKGLEFDDVILYNFFAETEAETHMWAVLRSINKMNYDNPNKPENFEDLENNLPKLSARISPNDPNYSMLCTELKHLYVAVTRPKKRLLIFDDDLEIRKNAEVYFSFMNVVQYACVRGGEVFVSSSAKSKLANWQPWEAFQGSFAMKTSGEEWKAQGIRMFAHKYYEQAEKCFEIAGEVSLALRAKGYTLANNAGNILMEIENKISQAQTEGKRHSGNEKKEIKLRRALAKRMFIEAAEAFIKVSANISEDEAIKVKKEAARCYSSGNAHDKAAKLFKELNLYGQAAEAEIACGNFEDAGDMFIQKDEYNRAIEAYKLGRNWEKLVKTIYNFKDKMSIEERQRYIQKYIPAALEDLTPKLIPQTEQDTQYIKQIVSEVKNVIAEDSDESGSENEEQADVPLEPIENPNKEVESNKEIFKPVEEIIEMPKENIENDLKVSETSVEQIIASEDSKNQTFDLIQDSQEKSESFVLLSKDSSFALLSEGIEDIDPADEWLQIETGSVVESLSSVINPDGTIASDFSMLDSGQGYHNGKIIKTRGDIFIEDSTMRKIIEYISMFSEEVTEYLKSLRSSSSLVSSQIIKEDWELVSLVDLDDLSSNMLGLILDTLEEYGMYRLCLIVCNRYNLIERAGRFIVSLAFKYSNLSMVTYPSYKAYPKEQIQRAAIAFTALHNVFEMINPNYLDAKKENSCLGLEAFQGMLLLGYWKKIIYLMDVENALAVAWTFGDFRIYKNLYVGNPEGQDIGFDWIPEEIKGEKDFNAYLIALDWYTLAMGKIKPDTQAMLIDKVPQCFALSQLILQCLKNEKEFTDSISKGFDIVKSYFSTEKELGDKEMLELFDAVNFYSIILLNLTHKSVSNSLVLLSQKDFESLLFVFKYIIGYLRNGQTQGCRSLFLRHVILSSAGVRTILPSSVTSVYPLYSHSCILQSSILLNLLSSSSPWAIDLECQIFMVSNNEITQAFVKYIIPHLTYIVKDRCNESVDISAKVNSIGELWMIEFISNINPYKLSSYDYLSKINPQDYQYYLHLKDQLKNLKAEDMGDIYYAMFMHQKNENKIKKIQKEINQIEKQMSRAQPGRRVKYMHDILNLTKYVGDEEFKITSIAKHALLTHAQIMMQSSEQDIPETRINHIWMAYEMCRISGNLLVFLEMLRGRHRQIFSSGKKVSKLSVAYYYSVGFVDMSVFYNHGCFSDVTGTLLDILDVLEFSDELRIFLLQKAVVYWAFSYSDTVVIPPTLEQFLPLKNQKITKNTGERKNALLEFTTKIMIEIGVKSIADALKIKFIEKICDCLSVIVNTAKMDNDSWNIIKKFKSKSGYSVCKSLMPYHKLFKILDDSYEKNVVEKKCTGTTIEVIHGNYPQRELDKEWCNEVKSIALHQKAANILKKKIVNKKLSSQSGLLEHAYKIHTLKILTNDQSKLLEVTHKYLKDLFQSLYRIILLKSLDMHFLLDQIYVVSSSLNDIDQGDAKEKLIDMEAAINRFESWKIMVRPSGTEGQAKVKRKWNVNWRKKAKEIKRR